MTKEFTLFVIDCQNDITKKDGALYVPSSENALNNICKFIEKNKNLIDKVILAKTNHPKDHCSFKGMGGAYNKYCVADTNGSKIDDRLIKVLDSYNMKYFELNHDEVSDFLETSASMYSSFIDGKFVLMTATDNCTVPTNDIVICGMPGDTTVNDTLVDLSKRFNNENIYVFLDGVANINQDVILNTLEIYPDINIV